VASNLTVPRLEFEKYRLKNGLEVILVEDHRLPLVAVNLWYHVGPANERPGLTGFAHLFEHMMFEGSRHVPEEGHFRLLEAAGASDINGTTDFDRTNYFETLPSNQLELALWLESDRMGFLLEKLDSAKLENQRDVVRNERRQSVEGTPYGLVQEELFHHLYPSDHPYYASVIGSHADIEAARLEDVREFFSLYYAPNNASLAVVGDIEKASAKELIEKYFGPIPAGPPVPPISVQTPPITSERRAVVTDRVELPRVYMAWITDPIFKPGDAECDLIARILGGGKSSRLYKRLVYEDRIAQDATAMQYSLALGSLFTIEATAKPGVQSEQLERVIDEELERFISEGPTPIELERARNTIQSAIVRALETLGGFGGVADRLNQYNHYLGDPGYLATDLARYDAATPERLREVAAARLRRANRVVVYGRPGEKVIHDVPRASEPDTTAIPEPAKTPGQEWRTAIPGPAHSSPLVLPVPAVFKLDNGLTVFLVEQHGLPIISANLVVLSGSECNPADRPGLASFTADMLDEGTKTRSALQIANDADQLGATLSSGSTTDMSYVAIRTLKRNTRATFELLADILLHPVFPESEIERVRHDRITHILQQRDNPGSVASKAFFTAVYGQTHPYGHTEIGSEQSVQSITREELVRFWQQGYVPGRSALVVAGDITVQELRGIAEELLGRWAGAGADFVLPETGGAKGRRVVIIDKPAAPQTTLRIGHVGIPRSDPDYIAVDVMNTALGGLFSSRINMNLREAHGYTYGASSGFGFRRGPGPFVVATNVRTDVTAAAVSEILLEIERMRAGEPTEEELATAKDSIARSLAGYFETTPQSASTAGQLFVHSLPLDFYRTLPGRVDAVSAADTLRVAGRHLHPEQLVIVAVGDKSRIHPQLEQADFGPVEFFDLDGKPIKA
jgi:zinc protease